MPGAMPGERLQSIAAPPWGSRIVNKRPFGRALRRFCRDMLPLVVEPYGYGFQDGGCLMLAHAIVAWSEGAMQLAAIYKDARGDQAQHVVARLGGLHLDSDGLGTEQDLIVKMERFEGRFAYRMGDYDQAGESVIPFHEELSHSIGGRLRRRFGAFDAGLLAAA